MSGSPSVADPVYFFNPESHDVFTLDADLNIVATTPRLNADELAVTCAFSRTATADRTWMLAEDRDAVDLAYWIAYDHAPTGGSILREIDARTGEVLRSLHTVTVPNVLPNSLRIAEPEGYKSLWDLGCNKLITVERATGQVIRLVAGSEANGVAFIDKRYGLFVDPFFDAILVDNDENLLYVDGNSLKLWSLKRDVFVRTVMTFGFAIAWPCALSDGTLLLAKSGDPFLDDFDILRVTTAGRIVKTYTYDQSTFTEGVYGFAGRLEGTPCAPRGLGPLVIAGDWDNGDGSDEQPAFIVKNLRSGAEGVAELAGVVEFIVLADDEDSASAFGLLEIVNLSIGAGAPLQRPRPKRVCKAVSRVVTVAPTAGCNGGGIGFTPSFTGASGVVPIADDPTGEDVFTDDQPLLVDVEIEHTTYPDETVEYLRYALVELDDAERKEGRIESIGDIEHGLSDAQGNAKAATIEVHIMDFDGRPMGTRKNFNRDPVTVRAITDRGRRAGGIRRMIGRGVCTGESYGGDGVIDTIVASDAMFAPGGAFGPDKRPCVPYPLSGPYANAPKDMANRFMPVVLGEVSDEGAKTPDTNLPNSRGKMPAWYMGMDTTLGFEAGRFNLALFANYKVVGFYGPDLGGLGKYGAAAVASLPPDIPPGSIDDDGTEEVDDTGATENQMIWQLDGPVDLAGVPTDGSFQLVPFTADGRQEFVIIGVDNITKQVITDGLIDPDAANGVPWYISSIDYVPRRVKIDLASRNGVDLSVPTWAGHLRPTPYEDFSCADGNFRVFDCWIWGALLAAHLAGDATCAWNGLGIEDKGDGSGVVITKFFTAKHWWMDHQLHEPKTQPTIDIGGGVLGWPQDAADLPAWSDGWSKTKGSDYALAQSVTAASLGGEGLLVSAYFADGISMRDALQLWLDNSGAHYENDNYGRSRVWMLDRTLDPATFPRVEHVSQVFGDVQCPVAHDETQNVVYGEFDPDPEAGTFRESALRKSTAAIRRNKGLEQSSKHIDGRLIARRAHFEWVLDRKLGMYMDAPRYVQIGNCGISLLNYANGTGIQFSSIAGPGANGWENRALIILSKTFHIQSQTVSLLCWDMGVSVGAAAEFGSLLIPPSQQFILYADPDDAVTIGDADADSPRLAA